MDLPIHWWSFHPKCQFLDCKEVSNINLNPGIDGSLLWLLCPIHGLPWGVLNCQTIGWAGPPSPCADLILRQLAKFSVQKIGCSHASQTTHNKLPLTHHAVIRDELTSPFPPITRRKEGGGTAMFIDSWGLGWERDSFMASTFTWAKVPFNTMFASICSRATVYLLLASLAEMNIGIYPLGKLVPALDSHLPLPLWWIPSC